MWSVVQFQPWLQLKRFCEEFCWEKQVFQTVHASGEKAPKSFEPLKREIAVNVIGDGDYLSNRESGIRVFQVQFGEETSNGVQPTGHGECRGIAWYAESRDDQR